MKSSSQLFLLLIIPKHFINKKHPFANFNILLIFIGLFVNLLTRRKNIGVHIF